MLWEYHPEFVYRRVRKKDQSINANELSLLSGRKQPDGTIGEKQNYFIEAEWEGNETKGLVQAARYLRLGGKGAARVAWAWKPRKRTIKTQSGHFI